MIYVSMVHRKRGFGARVLVVLRKRGCGARVLVVLTPACDACVRACVCESRCVGLFCLIVLFVQHEFARVCVCGVCVCVCLSTH